MDELIERLVAAAGIDHDTAESAVAIILHFLNKDGPPGAAQELIAKLPGAQDLLQSEPEADSGLFSMGGLMGAGSKMMAAGLSMGQVQSVTREVIAYAREKAGEDTVGAVVSGIPGLDQFV